MHSFQSKTRKLANCWPLHNPHFFTLWLSTSKQYLDSKVLVYLIFDAKSDIISRIFDLKTYIEKYIISHIISHFRDFPVILSNSKIVILFFKYYSCYIDFQLTAHAFFYFLMKKCYLYAITTFFHIFSYNFRIYYTEKRLFAVFNLLDHHFLSFCHYFPLFRKKKVSYVSHKISHIQA